MRVYVIVTLKSGARLLGEVQAESVEAAGHQLEKLLREPYLHLKANQDQIVAATAEVAAFQVSPNKP